MDTSKSENSLVDSDTNKLVTAEDIGISDEEYAALIRESIDCQQVEGHVRASNGRRVYAQFTFGRTDMDNDIEIIESPVDVEVAIVSTLLEHGDELPEFASIHSFADAGIMTTDSGFVLRLKDGSEYQVTIVRSK